MTKKISGLNFWKITTAVLFLMLLALAGFFLYNYYQNRSKKPVDKTAQYVKEISKLLVLPTDVPVLTPIDDIVKFKERDPLFFKSAKKGDVLLGFRDRVILYDPLLNKILNFASTIRVPPPPPLTPLRISLRYNGDDESRALNLKTQLEAVSPNYKIVEVVASKAQYSGDVVYQVNPKRDEDIIFLAQALGNSPILRKLEEKEVVFPNTDVIVAFRNLTPTP